MSRSTVNKGNQVLYRGDGQRYEVVSSYIQSRDRVTIRNDYGETLFVSSNRLRKLSQAEVSLVEAYELILEN